MSGAKQDVVKKGYGNVAPIGVRNIFNKGGQILPYTLKWQRYFDLDFSGNQHPYLVPYQTLTFWTGMWDRATQNTNQVESGIVPLSRYLFRPADADQVFHNEGFSGVGVSLQDDGIYLHVSHGLDTLVPRQEFYEVDVVYPIEIPEPSNVGIEPIQCFVFGDSQFRRDFLLHQLHKQLGKTLLFDACDLLGLDDAEYFLDVRVDREAELFDEL